MPVRLPGVESTDPILPDVVIDATMPYYDIRAYGAVGDGVTNDAAAITAAIAVATTNAGTVLIPRGRWAIASAITVPAGVNLVGEGSLWPATPTLRATTLLCTAAAGKVIVDGGGGTFGNFVIDGNNVGTGPLFHRRLGAERIFQSIHVTDSAGEGIRVDEAQNDLWINVQMLYATNCLVLDKGCGGHMFQSCEFASASGWHLVIEETTGTGPYGTTGPSHNTFDHCLFEFGRTAATPVSGCVDVKAGNKNVLRDCALSVAGYGASVANLRTNVVAPGVSADIELANCWIFGDALGAGLGIQQTLGTVHIGGRLYLQTLTNGWRFDGGVANVHGQIMYAAVTNKHHASSTNPIGLIYNRSTRPVHVGIEPTDIFSLIVSRTGDAAATFYMDPTGTHNWGSGAGATDTVLYRLAAGVLRTETKISVGTEIEIDGALNHDGTTVGFYNTTPIAKQTGVAVTAAGVHAALVALGLIT